MYSNILGRKILYSFFTIFASSVFIASAVNAQQNKYVRISGGAGFPDMIFASAKFQVSDRAWIGFSGGNYPFDKGSLLSLGGEFELDFHQREGTEAWKPIWFWREGAMYLGDQKERSSDTYIYLNTTFGARFYVFKEFGLSAEVGFASQLYHQKEEIYPGVTGWNFDFEKRTFYPAARIEIFTLVGPL